MQFGVQNCITCRFELPDVPARAENSKDVPVCACAEGIWTAAIMVLGDLEIHTEGGGGSSRRDPRWRRRPPGWRRWRRTPPGWRRLVMAAIWVRDGSDGGDLEAIGSSVGAFLFRFFFLRRM